MSLGPYNFAGDERMVFGESQTVVRLIVVDGIAHTFAEGEQEAACCGIARPDKSVGGDAVLCVGRNDE